MDLLSAEFSIAKFGEQPTPYEYVCFSVEDLDDNVRTMLTNAGVSCVASNGKQTSLFQSSFEGFVA